LSHIRGKPLVGESLLLLGPNARSALISVGINHRSRSLSIKCLLGLQNKNENYYWSRWRSPRRKRGPIITVSRQELVAFSSFSFRFAFHNFENVMKAKCALWLAENEKDTAQVLLVFFFSSSRFCCYWQPRFSWLNEMVFVVG